MPLSLGKFLSSMNAFLTRTLLGKKIFPVLNVVLCFLLAAAVLFFIRDIVSLSLPDRPREAASSIRPQPLRTHSLQDYSDILRNNPFGFPGGELRPLSAAAGSSISQSDLSLIGTVAGGRKSSYAIFMDRNGQQEVFRAGDSVFGFGTLSRVEKGRVFVHSNGSEIAIPLADVATLKEVKAPGSPESLARKTGDTAYLLDTRNVQQALEKPNQIMTDARFMPNMVEGKQQGFLLTEVKPGGIYSSLGLRNGDVLLRINEFNISSPEAALQALTALRGIDRAQLDVIRNGSRITMTYQIR
jgi:general secretion pathway protein C